MTARRYWMTVAGVLCIAAAALPLGRVTETLLDDLQILYVLALLALLAFFLGQACARHKAAIPQPRR